MMTILADIFGPSWGIVFRALQVLADWAPVWLPILLLLVFWQIWMAYIRQKEIAKMDWMLLEVKLPEEITKSPAAMELVLSAFWQSDSATNFIKKFWIGKIMDWFSLEMVSFGGEVHFFIRSVRKYQKVIEARIYAQYPTAEVVEVPDYVDRVEFDRSKMNVLATEYKLKKPDPYPILTYVDYGLDRDPKEELKIDPIVAMLEYLGSLNPDEQVWHQILVRKHVKRLGRRKWFKKEDWQEDAKELLEKLKKEYQGDKERFSFQDLSEIQKQTLTAIERSITKNAFEVVIRSLYIAPNESYNEGPNLSGLWGSFFQINSPHLNGLEGDEAHLTNFKYPWQDFREIRMNKRRKELFDAYKARGGFYPPFRRHYFILNTEELATIFHFPGQVAQTPTFDRVLSRKAEPPSSLPI